MKGICKIHKPKSGLFWRILSEIYERYILSRSSYLQYSDIFQVSANLNSTIQLCAECTSNKILLSISLELNLQLNLHNCLRQSNYKRLKILNNYTSHQFSSQSSIDIFSIQIQCLQYNLISVLISYLILIRIDWFTELCK